MNSKEIDYLIIEAFRRYPVGTSFANARSPDIFHTIRLGYEGFSAFTAPSYTEGQFGIKPIKGDGLVYFDGKWADIVEVDELGKYVTALEKARKIIYED